MFRRFATRLAGVDAATGVARPDLGIPEFVDPAFLANKRPVVPGGAWTKELLRTKSLSDLQQIWFILLKERNMLLSTKEHYMKHMEELGAWPAPSRLKMCDESMSNLKEVVRERDFEANDRATEIFMKRVKEGVYRYPAGPPLPPGSEDPTSTISFQLDEHVTEERLRELFGRFDVFEDHKGIVSVRVTIDPAVLEAKEAAEVAWEEWRASCLDYEEYQKVGNGLAGDGISQYDVLQQIELAPGKFTGDSVLDALAKDDSASMTLSDATDTSNTDVVVASKVPVPEPQRQKPKPRDPLKRLQEDALPVSQRRNIQLGYFPNVTLSAPPKPGPRPVHPDELLGPWNVEITYDSREGAGYGMGLGITRIDGVDIVAGSMKESTTRTPHADRCPIYQEALRAEEADAEHQMRWPQVPHLSAREVAKLRVKPVHEIVSHNWSNVLDYAERETLLTSKSVWEMPVEVDASCGDAENVPPGWTPPDSGVIDETPERWDDY